MMQDFYPKVTIVIPVYNGANYLADAIDSALAQDYPNVEVIVVNDGSRDGSEGIAHSYGDRIRCFSKANGGVSTALNLGIEKAAGDYISWLSHDDMYLPGKISSQVRALRGREERESLIPYCDHRIVNVGEGKEYDVTMPENDPLVSRDKISTENDIMLLLTGSINGCSLLIPKRAFSECGFFDPNLKTTQDYQQWFAFAEHRYHFVHVDEVLMISRRHAGQDSRTKRRLCKKEQKALLAMVRKKFVKGNPYGLRGKRLEYARNRCGFGSMFLSVCKWTWRFVPVRSLRVAMREHCRAHGKW